MYVSSPVIIGNMRDARQMFPDPDWKAEDQRGARDRTSGSNNGDDNHRGDMPGWMFKEESYRGEAKTRDEEEASPDQEKW